MKRYLFIALFFFSFGFISSQERNLQLWNQNKLEVKINERISFGASEKVSYQPKSGEMGSRYGELFIKREMAPWFNAGLTGRLLWIRNDNGWIHEYRPMVFGNLSYGLGVVDFELSNRLEYRMYKYLDDHFRHRHMLSAEIPPFDKATWFRWYVGEEAFYRFDKEKFHLVRFHTGTKIKCRNFLEMKLFYVFEKSKKSFHWTTNDILGLNMSFDF